MFLFPVMKFTFYICAVTVLYFFLYFQVRTKNLFNVADCKMHWQKCGDYLCLKVARYAKAKREKNEVKYSGIYYNFEIFHMREKGIAVDSLEIKENIQVGAYVRSGISLFKLF